MTTKNRVEILDSFRFLAVTAVIFYHYYSYWTPPIYPVNKYPYGDRYADYFIHGNLGVQFFFIISGFVIFFTLENSKSFYDFFKRRVSRLLPPMLLCSVLVYGFVNVADPSNSFGLQRNLYCFLPSLTFVKPDIWNAIFHTTSFKWVSGVHWSLWHEVQFYAVSSIIFFSSRKKFVDIYALIAVTLIVVGWATENISVNNFLLAHKSNMLINVVGYFMAIAKSIFQYFDLYSQIGYFSIGIFIYLIYNKRKITLLQESLFLFILYFQFHAFRSTPEKYAYFLILVLFIMFLLNSKFLNLLNIKPLQRIGVISYTIYLIHSEIGLILINKIANQFAFIPPVVIPILVYGMCIAFAELSFRYYEKRAAKLVNTTFDKLKESIKPLSKSQAPKAN